MIEEPGAQETISLPRGAVVQKFLPEPDFLDFSLAENQIALLTDDGTDATPAVARALAGIEWKVVVLSMPEIKLDRKSRLPVGVEHLSLSTMTEDELVSVLDEAARRFGKIAAFIHLHPPGTASLNGGLHFPESDRALLRHVFLVAKHLKEPLNVAAGTGRSIFMTVARLDGKFGLGGGSSFNPMSGGLFGLVKTLGVEWPKVFCRALDISPAFEPVNLAEAVVAELFDPNRLICEVGYSLDGRSTLVVEPLQEKK